jgi:hypothetical protein
VLRQKIFIDIALLQRQKIRTYHTITHQQNFFYDYYVFHLPHKLEIFFDMSDTQTRQKLLVRKK